MKTWELLLLRTNQIRTILGSGAGVVWRRGGSRYVDGQGFKILGLLASGFIGFGFSVSKFVICSVFTFSVSKFLSFFVSGCLGFLFSKFLGSKFQSFEGSKHL